MTPEEFARQFGVTLAYERTTHNEFMEDDPNAPKRKRSAHWRCRLVREGIETNPFTYSKGCGHRRWKQSINVLMLPGAGSVKGLFPFEVKPLERVPFFEPRTVAQVEALDKLAEPEPPTAGEVLGCLATDARSVECSSGFEDWAADLGMDPDSRSAERAYFAIQRQTAELRRVLGATAFTVLLEDVED